MEREVVKELNLARTDPRYYVSHLKEMKRFFYGEEFRRPGEIPVRTEEGVTALVEAIRFLEKAKPVLALRFSQGMSRGARDYVEVQGRSGAVGHGSIDGKRTWERVNLYGKWERMIGENLSYGYSHARDIIISLIIDDGVPGRGHRKNIFNPNFQVVGVACGSHAIYGTMCVILFAGGYLEK